MKDFTLKDIKTLTYQRPPIEKGYANQTLCMDISAADITIKPVSDKMKQIFVGGKGFDLWLLWHAVRGKTKWTDPENAICMASGPMGVTPSYPGSGKSIVTSLAPLTALVIDSNVCAFFGPYLIF